MSSRTRIVVLTATVLITLLVLIAPASAITLTADEQYMLNLVNKERRANGLNSLEIDLKLQLMARRYAKEMIDNNFFSHTSPVSGELLDRVNAAGVSDGWLLAGENLAGAPTVESAFQGLMNSPTHKDNMLEGKYTHVGIGVIDGGPYGKMFAQEFIAYPKSMFYASNDPKLDLLVYINERMLYSDPPAFIESGHVLVPARQLFEELGAQVTWDNQNQTIFIKQLDLNIMLTTDSDVAFVNGQAVLLDSKPVIKRGATFVPLRFVAEAFGANVTWDSKLRTAEVTQYTAPN